jgi:hypothetical protein
LTELRRPELLDPRLHNGERFDSGEPRLDDWLHRTPARTGEETQPPPGSSPTQTPWSSHT